MASSLSVYSFLVLFCCMHHAVARNNESATGSFCSRECERLEEKAADNESIPLYHCSCSPSCSVYGDCCRDSPHKNTSNTLWHHRDFICLSVVGHDRYLAVSGCPPGQSADFCKDGLGHLPPVTSRVTNVTYANVFCAQCNGDRGDLIMWKVELRCSSDVSTAVDAKYIYQSGRIWSFNEATGTKTLCKYYVHNSDSSFLDALELRSCWGNVKKVSRCSPSWKDLSVLEMCRSYEDPVYFYNRAFRNIHCAECNYMNLEYANCIPSYLKRLVEKGVVNLRVKKYCKTRGSNTCIQYLSDYSKGKTYAIHFLFIHEKGCVPPSGKRCCDGEAFDFRSRRCREIRNWSEE